MKKLVFVFGLLIFGFLLVSCQKPKDVNITTKKPDDDTSLVSSYTVVPNEEEYMVFYSLRGVKRAYYNTDELGLGDYTFMIYNNSDEFENYLNRENYFFEDPEEYFYNDLKVRLAAKFDEAFFTEHSILLIEYHTSSIPTHSYIDELIYTGDLLQIKMEYGQNSYKMFGYCNTIVILEKPNNVENVEVDSFYIYDTI